MKLLLLAGTPEATQIARALARVRDLQAVAALAQPSSAPEPLGLATRIGGWGGEAAFADWLEHEAIGAVLDATHPFSHGISHRAQRVCARLGLEYMQFLRPAWVPGEEDDWTFLNAGEEAAHHVPEGGSLILMAGGRCAEAFQNLGDRTIYMRVRERGTAPFPFDHGKFLHRPVPVAVEMEEIMLRSLKVDWVIAQNAGGAEGAPLLAAASRLGLPVGMIRRPPQPQGPRIRTVTEALAWARRRM